MLNISTVQNDNLTKLNAFEREVQEVYNTLVLPHWGGELHGFPYTLYGYMMTCFARIDLLSSYWKGNDNRQTERMIAFMDEYISPNREANSLAVQVMPYRILCNDVQREGVKAIPDLASGFFYYVSLHKIRYGISPSAVKSGWDKQHVRQRYLRMSKEALVDA